jgi:hypothetical protein
MTIIKGVLQVSLSDKLMLSPEILKYVKAIECYPNVSIVYQILLTVPVTVASSEVSLSKLKLLKKIFEVNYVRKRLMAWLCASLRKIF